MSENERAAVREDVIESIERSTELYGLSRSTGRVYGVLYFADEPLSIPELVERTGYAKSTISTATRKLARIGMIHRRSSDGGGRRVRFTPETDLWYVLQDVFRQYVDREMQVSKRTLSDALAELDAIDDGRARRDRERIHELTTTYDQLHTLFQLAMDSTPEELITALQQANTDAEADGSDD